MKLLVFSRRALQQRLDALESKLDSMALDNLIARMNRKGNGRLPAMWETVWLHAIGEVGPFENERPLPNGTQPDFRFTVPVSGRTVEVIGDITCVSDRGLHENNPVSQFWIELVRHILTSKLDPNHFRYQIGHHTEGDSANSRIVLRLPPRSHLTDFVKQQVAPWLRELAKSRVAKATTKIVTDEADISLSYDVNQEFAGGGHAAYNLPTSARRNPVYTQLKKKEDQLRAAPDDALRVVILCDAGCHAMQKSPFTTTLSADEVTDQFLRKSSVLDLVVLVSVEAENHYDLNDRRLRVCARVCGTLAALGTRRTTEAGTAVREYLDCALAHLPAPVLDSHNASLRVSISGQSSGNLGIIMTDKKVRLSARVVLSFLAGKISTEEFQRTYGWHPGSEYKHQNPFANALERGQLFTASSVQSAGDADDDWLEFEFGSPDPAVSAFCRRR